MKPISISLMQVYGKPLGATDGPIGHVKDFYFDDKKWTVRYVVVDTGTWLPGREVILSPHAFGQLHQDAGDIHVNLSRKQIETSPSIATHKPVSRQQEEAYYRHYGWPFYWQGDGLWGPGPFPVAEPADLPAAGTKARASMQTPDLIDPHLRSAQAVSGYHVKALDGTNGHICDFVVNGQNWSITDIVVKTGHRFSGREVRLATDKVDHLSYDESAVHANVTVDQVEQCPPHHPAPPPQQVASHA